LAKLTREDIIGYKNPEDTAGIAGLPPGYIEGFEPTLQNNLTVSIGGGITSVQGRRVERESYILRRADWDDTYTGGAEGFYFYVYLTREGDYQVSMIKPVYTAGLYYWAHPAWDWRVVLRLWIDSDDEIKYVSKDFRDTPRNVTVAPNNYVGMADYYCDGVNDEVWIKAAIEYADRVELLTGTFEIFNAITITKENWELFGAGAVIKPTAAITLGSGSTLNNMTLRNLRVKAMPTYKSLFVGDTVNSLVVDGCTFEMNTGFTVDTCNYLSVRNNFFKGIENYMGGSLTFTDSASVSIVNNSFRYYGVVSQNKLASIICAGSSGSILDNTFLNSGSILLDSSSDVAFSISGNDHQNPVLFWDEGDATYGPGVAYGSNTKTV